MSSCQISRARRRILWVVGSFLWFADQAKANDLEQAPIYYTKAPANNAISRLQQRLDTGKASLGFDKKWGYLPALLNELKVPRSSQTLVFSKTSMQRHRISPRTPRALYFNDEVYVGYCQYGAVVELTAVDPHLGAAFYTLEQKAAGKPRIVRQDYSCLVCHGSSQNQGFPGLLVRSVYVDNQGLPILSSGTFRIDQTSPLKERWGGWYVSGTHGQQKHLGNLIVRDSRAPEEIDNTPNLNVTDLSHRFRTADYLTPHSDIVALMVLEHQAEMHNRIARASFLTRIALYEEAELNKALGRPASQRSDLTQRRIKSACEPVVKYLLFSGEAPLTAQVQGTSDFAREFAQQGPRDPRGRSLREFDLKKRLFKYPCSYLIYSDVFDTLPEAARDYVLERLWDVLNQYDNGNDFAHLSADDCEAIRAILLTTKKNAPAYWRSKSASDSR
jgi:hypothetical protein